MDYDQKKSFLLRHGSVSRYSMIMTDNPFDAPQHDEPGKLGDSFEAHCPHCGFAEMAAGYIVSAMRIEWMNESAKSKNFSLTRGGEEISQASVFKGARAQGFKCPSCGLIVLLPKSDG